MSACVETNFRQKDDAAGEVPVAFVVRAADSDIAEEAIKEFVSKQVDTLTWQRSKNLSADESMSQ
jgi:hypothetical protein